MQKISKLAVLLGVFLVFISSASAIPELLVDVQPIEDEINYNSVAQYVFELTNNLDESVSISIPTPRNDWDITITPYLFELPSHQSKKIDVSISQPETVESGIYSIYFEFKEDGRVLDYRYIHVTILEESPVFSGRISLVEEIEARESWSEGFLSKSYTAVLKNKGQTHAIGIWEIEVNDIEQFFLTAEPQGELKEQDGSVKLTWDYSLAVNDEMTYTYTVSYISVLIAICALSVALISLGFYYSSRYRLIKTVKKGRGGFIHVEIALKNKTRKKQKNITLEDYIPVPLMLSREFGTMSPTAIRKSKDKLVLTWKFDELEPKEERMLSYKMKSKIKVEGKVIIPAAAAFQRTKKKKIQVYSKIRQR